MKFNNKRDSPDCTLTKIILISYLLSNIIMFFVLYNPWVYKRVYCPVTTETEITIETEPTETTEQIKQETIKELPKTGINVYTPMVVALVSLISFGLYFNKKENNK